MYQIYADNVLIYDSGLEDYVITRGEIDLEVSRSGSFVFSVYQNNPAYDMIRKLKTIITVYRDQNLVFRGRVIRNEDGFYNDRTFTCEGELSFLLDSIQRPYTFTGSPAALFRQFITNHNAQIDPDKRFEIGQITVINPNDHINRSNSGYENTYNLIMSKLVESVGGYLWVTNGDGGRRVINWLAGFSDVSAQKIEFGENLMDFAKTNNAEDIATALIPLGAKLNQEEGAASDEEKRLTIASVNGGLDYIYDQAAVDEYGWIFATETWDDVTLARNLLSKGQARLSEIVNLAVSIELSAIDLSNMGKDIQSFQLGEYINVTSAPHNLDATYLLSKQHIDLLHPENDKITLGYTFATLTDRTLKASTSTGAIAEAVKTISNTYASNSAVEEKLSSYVTSDQLLQSMEMLIASLSDAEARINQKIADAKQSMQRMLDGGSWTDLTVDPAFVVYDNDATYQPQYKIIGKQVYLRGAVSPAAAYVSTAAPVVAAAGLPAEVRPPYVQSVLCQGTSGEKWLCSITTNGEVAVSQYDAAGSAEIPTTACLAFAINYCV